MAEGTVWLISYDFKALLQQLGIVSVVGFCLGWIWHYKLLFECCLSIPPSTIGEAVV